MEKRLPTRGACTVRTTASEKGNDAVNVLSFSTLPPTVGTSNWLSPKESQCAKESKNFHPLGSASQEKMKKNLKGESGSLGLTQRNFS